MRALWWYPGMAYRMDHLDAADEHALQRLGLGLKGARQARGWSQRDLERASGVDQSMISRFERGLAPGLHATLLARLLAGLDADVVAWPHAWLTDGRGPSRAGAGQPIAGGRGDALTGIDQAEVDPASQVEVVPAGTQ